MTEVLRWMADKHRLFELAGAVRESGASFLVPVIREGAAVFAESLSSDVSIGRGNTKLPLKTLLFPRSEILYAYAKGSAAEAALPDTRSVVFGTRPCDAHSLLHLDKVFLDEKFTDPYYKARRDNTTIISLSCSDPRPTCFCTSVNGGPADAKGSDAIVHELGDGLLFQSCTEKGEGFLARFSALFSEPESAVVMARDRKIEALEKEVPRIDLAGLEAGLEARFASEIWREISASCLGCGVCTYLCPTCHCFAIHDDGFIDGGKRVRVHDSCMYPSFTAEASGHNPRKRKTDRVRQRVMHKFRYTVENYGETFCVGCGRCITECPVNIDVRETIAEMRK